MASSTIASSCNSGGAEPGNHPHKTDYAIVVLLYISLVRGDSNVRLFSSYLDSSVEYGFLHHSQLSQQWGSASHSSSQD
jgi:hypothetical protein